MVNVGNCWIWGMGVYFFFCDFFVWLKIFSIKNLKKKSLGNVGVLVLKWYVIFCKVYNYVYEFSVMVESMNCGVR